MNNSNSARPVRNALFVFLLLASGFCGISYEILYGRILGNLIGDQFAVSASVLLTFLLGIGFGTLYAHRLWRHLWAVEAGIGVCGVAFALGTRALDSFLYAAGGWFGHSLGASVAMCLLLLSAPSFLIGCSLPLFAGYLSRVNTERVFSLAYTIYNFGAAVTALLIEYWLLRCLGIRATVLAIAAINVVVALALRFGFSDLRQSAPPPTAPVRFPKHHLVALALASVASAIFQLLMVKMAECVMGPFRETFALVLAVVFLGLAVGSAVTGRWRIGFPALLLANLVGLVWLLGGFGWMARSYAELYPSAVESYFASVLLKFGAIVAAMWLPAATFGATIPALLREQENVARESGQLLFVSSVANAFGFLLMAFVLHRFLDYGVLVVVIAALVSVSALVFWKFRPAYVAAALVAMALMAGLHRMRWDENLLYLGHTAFHSTEELKRARGRMLFPDKFKGYQDTFAINWVGGSPYFFINGFISFRLDSPYEKLVGAYASLYAPRTDKALVLGLGSGATGGAVSLLFDRVDAVEINPVVVQNLYRMKDWNFDIESRRPHVNIVVDDAIHYTKASRETYSLIVNTVTTPLYFSSSKLYTHDFFESVQQRLTPDGVYMTWVDSRVGDNGLNIILKTLQQSFSNCSIACIQSTYYLLLCARQPLTVRNAKLVAENRLLTDFLWKENGLRTDWMPYALLTTRAYDVVQGIDAPVNTLDFPALEFEIARLRKRGIDDFKRRIQEHMDITQVESALAPTMAFDAVDFTIYNEVLHGPSAISRRWKELAAEETQGFEARFKVGKARYLAARADSANAADAYHEAGMEAMRAGQDRAAIEEFGKALELNPKRNNAHFNLGSCYERLGKFEQALAEYGQERAVDPTDGDVPYRLGRVYSKMGRYRAAADALDQAIAISPAEGAAYYYRGLAAAALGDMDRAKANLEQARRLKYDSDAVSRALEDVRSRRGSGR